MLFLILVTYIMVAMVIDITDCTSPVIVHPIHTPITGNITESISLQWNITSSNARPIKRFLVYEQPKHFIIDGNPTDQIILSLGKQLYGDRLSASFNDSIYTLTLTRLSYNDTRTFRLTIDYGDAVSSDIVIKNVFGGPNLIGEPIQPNYTFHEGESLNLSILAQGNPIPIVQWMFNDVVSYSNGRKEENYYIYNYTYQLPKLEAKHCGKLITYSVSGYHKENSMSNSTLVIVDFTPHQVTGLYLFTSHDNSIIVEWNPLDIGNCDVIYILQFSIAGKYLKTVKINSTSLEERFGLNKYRYKSYSKQLLEATDVIIWAKRKHIEGIKSLAKVIDKKRPCWLISALIIGILAILLVGLTIVYVCKIKGQKDHEKQDDEELTKTSATEKQSDKLSSVT